MKAITLILIVFSVMARAEDEGVEFYFSKMRWSSKPDPLDAGAIDGAYYADVMASHGVRKVDFHLVSAKEMLNPRWNSKTSDDHESAHLTFVAANRFRLESKQTLPLSLLFQADCDPLLGSNQVAVDVTARERGRCNAW